MGLPTLLFLSRNQDFFLNEVIVDLSLIVAGKQWSTQGILFILFVGCLPRDLQTWYTSRMFARNYVQETTTSRVTREGLEMGGFQ